MDTKLTNVIRGTQGKPDTGEGYRGYTDIAYHALFYGRKLLFLDLFHSLS